MRKNSLLYFLWFRYALGFNKVAKQLQILRGGVSSGCIAPAMKDFAASVDVSVAMQQRFEVQGGAIGGLIARTVSAAFDLMRSGKAPEHYYKGRNVVQLSSSHN